MKSINLKDKMNSLIQVPLVRQATDYTCGVACVESILRLGGYEFNDREDTLVKALKADPDFGTENTNMVEYLNNAVSEAGVHPFKTEAKLEMTLEDLMRETDKGNPVIVAIQAWADDENTDYMDDCIDGHYVIVIGYDDDNLYFMDPSTLGCYTYMPKNVFLTRWHDIDGDDNKVEHLGLIVEIKKDYSPDIAYPLL